MLKSFVILAAGLILMAGTIEYAPTRTLESGMAYVWDFIHASHEEIIAIATIFIAIYTIILGTATSALVKEAKITTKHQLRAYIGVKAVSIHTPNVSNKNYKVPDPIPAEGYVWSDLIKIIVKNFGSTPASNIAVYLNWQPTNFGGRLMKDFAYGDLGDDEGTLRYFIDGGGEHVVTIRITDLSIFRDANKRTTSLHFYGHIDYTDIFKNRWRRDFCYIYEPWRPEGERFSPHEEHNEERQIK